MDYSLQNRFADIEAYIGDSKATTVVDRLSIRKESNKVCLSDLTIAQVLYEVWYPQSMKDTDLQIEYSNLIVMVGSDELPAIINDLELVINQAEDSIEEGDDAEEKTGKDEEGVTSQYKSNKSGEEGEVQEEGKPKEKKK